MTLDAAEIRRLRQRLGWSVAEMARRMGCSTELVLNWELGTHVPEAESYHQLQFLNEHVESNSLRVQSHPVAEVHMELHGLGQLTGRDLLKDN